MNIDAQLKKFIKKGIKPGLDRVIKSISSFLDIDNPTFKIIHIAGTNGKGTTATLLSNYLTEIGIKVGLFTSPHIKKVNERIKINGIDIDDKTLSNLIFIIENKYSGDELTYFEILNVIALKYFKDQKVDFVILETGLGGRLDSTNATAKYLSIITHVDYDHENILGDDILTIFKEKFAISNRSKHTLLAPQKYEEINQFLKDVDKLKFIDFNFINLDNRSEAFKMNFSLFLSSIKFLSKNSNILYDGQIIENMKNLKISGRLEEQKFKNYTIIKDVAHNLNGIKNLVSFIEKKYNNKKFVVYFSALEDKKYNDMINELSKIAKLIYFYPVDSIETQRCSASFDDIIKKVKTDIKIELKKNIRKEEINYDTLFCGSFYLISQINKIF